MKGPQLVSLCVYAERADTGSPLSLLQADTVTVDATLSPGAIAGLTSRNV